jgi:high-affinity iron transporter
MGLVAALPLTAIAGWLFQSSSYQARWESLMAIGATAIVFASGWSVWRRIAVPESRSSGAASMLWKVALAAATALVVVRQTMVMAAVFGAAAIQMRSLDATAVVSGAAALALCSAIGWVWVGNRLPERGVVNATRTFGVLFLAQVAFYAVHKSAEARFLPWSDAVDRATEPYGPDSMFGLYVSYLLVGLPMMAAVFSAMRGHQRSAEQWRPVFIRARRTVLAVSGIIVAVFVVLAGTKARGLITPRVSEAAVAAPAIELESIAAAPHFLLDPGLSLPAAHDIADQVERAIQAELPGSDVTVHTEPAGPN